MSVTKQWPSQGVVNVTPTSYPIPQAGDLNWADLTDFLVALANGAQSTTFQRYANRTAITSPVTVNANDCIINTNLTVPGPVAIDLPAGVDKQVFYIADNKFDAATNPITITPNGIETIGGAATYVLNSNGEGLMIAFQSSTLNWNVVANSKPNPSGGSVGGFTPNISIISDGAGNLTSSSTTATEIGYVSGVTSSIQTQLNNKQPLDGDLTAIAALATTGLATRTAADTWTTRTITAGSSKISVTNGDGVAADPSIDAVEASFTLDNIGGTLSVTKGGTGVTSVTTAPTATAFAGWDVNSNLSANAFIPGYTTTVTSGGTLVLTVASDQLQYFTGATTHTLTLPVAATLVTGQSFHVVNNSSGAVTVQSSGANLVQLMAGSSFATFTCVLASGTTAASWNVEYNVATAGTVTSVDVSGGTTGLTTSGGPVTTSGTITIAGTLVVANGGTGITSGTSGGIPGFTGATTISSSALLTNDQVIVGGGAGATPKTLAAGTAGQFLLMNSTPIPAWSTILSPTINRLTSGSGNYSVPYYFFVSAATAIAGATYTNNTFTFTVLTSIAGGVLLTCTGTGAPTASGTLTKATGTGDATITFTAFSKPSYLMIEQVGGGGGGGGGAGGAAGGNGTAGGNTTFSAAGGAAFVTCNGGGRGGGGGVAVSDPGGTVTIGSPAVTVLTLSGQRGSSACLIASGSGSTGGLGGASGLGPGGGALAGSTVAGDPAPANSGAGGSGGATGTTSQNQGGGGGSGGGYARFLIPAPLAASYDYSIGGAGGGGTAGGATGGVGGAGAAGIIIITQMFV